MSQSTTKQTKWLCAQGRLRSAWISAQSDQSLRYPHKDSLDSLLYVQRQVKTDQAGQMPRLIWVFLGHIWHLLALSCSGSNEEMCQNNLKNYESQGPSIILIEMWKKNKNKSKKDNNK